MGLERAAEEAEGPADDDIRVEGMRREERGERQMGDYQKSTFQVIYFYPFLLFCCSDWTKRASEASPKQNAVFQKVDVRRLLQ